MAPKKIILNITPQTHVRATQGDRVLFRIPRTALRAPGLKRLLRLERYNEYKLCIAALAKEQHFSIPPQGCRIYFFIPVSRSWSQKKKTRMHFTLHQEKPDLDNLFKAMADGLLAEDKQIAHIQLAKFWVDFPQGWIEIYVDDPAFHVWEIPASAKEVCGPS